MSHEKKDKKHKKLAQLLHNRQVQAINLQADTLGRERDLEREREEEKRDAVRASARTSAAAKQGSKPVWSAKMQQIRDKNTGRTRMAAERWNRFAGTESGGGRGL